MNLISYLANSIWKFISKKKFKKFILSSSNSYQTQEKYLLKLLKNNEETEFGKLFRLRTIQSINEFQNNVPITEYEDYETYIEKIRNGETNILTREPILRFTLTSGTTSASKWIPYNKSLKKEFDESLGIWIYNLFKNYPDLKYGSAYWSISPILDKREYNSKIPVGFEEDSAYFGYLERYLVNSIQAVPSLIKNITNFNDFKYLTLLFLLSDSNLRLISVWSPSYLIILLDYFPENSESILKDIEQGTISIDMDQSLKDRFQEKINKNPGRANYLKQLTLNNNFSWKKVWKHLTLISLWTDGNSNQFVSEIQNLFPDTIIQGKGLLSTEGFVSFPLQLDDFYGNVLAINSHFFEFRDCKSKLVFLPHQLKENSIYEIVLTTGGGLYRYATKDRVKITGYFNEVPAFTFIGKEESISDLVGEKLSESYLTQVLTKEFEKHNISPLFYFVEPKLDRNVGKYILFLQSKNNYKQEDLSNSIDSILMDNIYYAHARNIGQLAKFQVKSLPVNSLKTYFLSKSKITPIGTVKYSLFYPKANQNI